MNPFEVLGIPPTSNAEEIKAVYRKLAFKYHPDRNTPEASNENFVKIKDAYEKALKLIGSNIPIEDGFDQFGVFTISVKESLGFLNRSYQISRSVSCDCGSLGAKCLKCHGSKYVKVGLNLRSKCDRCNGSGYENPNNCHRCGGSGVRELIESVKLSTNYPISDGETRFYKYSLGKLTITFKIKKSESDIYDRIGNDLVYIAKISPLDQILGTTLYIPRINQESLKLQVKENVLIPSYYKIANSGVPGTNGDLIIKLVSDPNLLDKSLIPIIRKAVGNS